MQDLLFLPYAARFTTNGVIAAAVPLWADPQRNNAAKLLGRGWTSATMSGETRSFHFGIHLAERLRMLWTRKRRASALVR